MNRVAEARVLPFVFENIKLSIGASIGLAVYPDNVQSLEQLLEYTDFKMYKNKREKGKLILILDDI